MREFKSQGQAQRFLSCDGVVNHLFRLGRHLMKASSYRMSRDRAFVEWGRASCVQNLAKVAKSPFNSSDPGNLTVPSKEPAHEKLVGVHRVVSLIKRWLLGTHQGSFNMEHLDAYLNEYAFRFNRRTSRSRGLLFFRLLEQAVKTTPIRYNDVKIS